MSTLVLILTLCSLTLIATAQQPKLSDEKREELEERLKPIGGYWYDKEYDKALKLVNKILKKYPDFVPALTDKAHTYRKMGKEDRFEHYEALYARVLFLQPKSVRSYIGYAVGYVREKNYQAAYEIYTQAIDSIPNNSELYEKRAEALFELGKGDLAIKDFTQAIHLTPQDSGLYSRRGWKYLLLGELDKALADFTKAISIAPKHHGYYSARAFVKEHHFEDYRGALADYTKAYRLTEGGDKKGYLKDANNCKQLIGIGYQMQGLDAFLALDYAQAIRYYKESLKWNLSEKGVQESNKYIKLAQQFLAKRQQQANAEKNKEKVARNALLKGKTLFGQKKYREALPYLEKAAVKMDLYLEPAQALEAYELYQDCKLEVAKLEKAVKKD